jgi:hypothetical protein
MAELSDDELLEALGISIDLVKETGRAPREERIIAGFEDIQRFFETSGRAPQHGEGMDIFERLYAVRLDRLRALPELHNLLASLDTQGLLVGTAVDMKSAPDDLDDDALLAELGLSPDDTDNINVLKHVRTHKEIQPADEVASRTVCKDFADFEPLFEQAERHLKNGLRHSRRFGKDASIETGDFFILGGQVAYVANVGESMKAPNGDSDARLRVIYSNGTESNLLLRSLQRALYKDETGRRLTEPDAGPLFRDQMAEDDIESGSIYVLRSLSKEPIIAPHRDLLHKIGVTGGDVKTRVANAVKDSTYLFAEVEVIATYKLSHINRTKLENLLHRIFAPAQLDFTIPDRFGQPVKPREWFLVPLPVIDEAIQRIRDRSITNMVYDPTQARLVEK